MGVLASINLNRFYIETKPSVSRIKKDLSHRKFINIDCNAKSVIQAEPIRMCRKKNIFLGLDHARSKEAGVLSFICIFINYLLNL